MRTFEFHDPKSHKFWTIDVRANTFTVRYGKVGTTGQTQAKTFLTPDGAQAGADKLVREKIGKGYLETTPPVATAEAVAFELALAVNPDDLAGWNAYADYLAEQGHPRGEFMQVQLALEDDSRPKDERKKLRARETKLLKTHEREWLGELAQCLLDPAAAEDDQPVPNPEYRWQHGYLSGLTVHRLTTALAQTLATTPAARFLRELRVHDTHVQYFGEGGDQPPFRVPTPQGIGRHWELLELIGAPCLRGLKIFQMGGEEPAENGGWSDCHTYAPGLEHVVAGMAHIEELHLLCKTYDLERLIALRNLTHLRVLRVYHLGVRDGTRDRGRYEYPLDVLARNPALTNLTHLLFHPHHEEYHTDHYGQDRKPSFLPLDQVRAVLRSKHLTRLTHLQLRLSNIGDAGVREILASGILERLKWLDLRHGCITDEGARLFAACPDARRLERLDLSRNAVTPTGLAALRAAKINAVANNPLTPQELTDEQYLFEGDSE